MATVTGPASSTDTAIARWNGTTGTVIQDSTVTIDGSGNVTGIASLAGSPTTTTQSAGDNSTKISTTAYVDGGLSTLALDKLTDCITNYAHQSMYVGQNCGVLSSNLASSNTAVGVDALANNVGGNNNTAVGFSALYAGTSSNNTAVGNAALALATQPYNTAVGMVALNKNTSGDSNTAIGYASLNANITGQKNTALGMDTALTLTSGSNNICIGYNADVPASGTSNYLNIGDVITGQMNGTPALNIAGSPTTTTQSAGDNSTKIATTAYVDGAVSGGAGASPLVGSTRNGKMSVTTASATATYTADEIIVETALGGSTKKLSSYSQSINLGATGAGGMDTGSAPNNGWVSLYAIAKADGTKSILACNESTSNTEVYSGGNMPSGYSYSALIGIWITNGSGQFTTGYLMSRTFWHGASVNVINNSGGSSPTSYTSITLTAAVPAKANGLFGTIGVKDNNYSTWQLSSTSGGLIQRAYIFSEVGGNSGQTYDGFSYVCGPFDFPLPTAQTMYYRMYTSANSSRMNINGFTF